MAARWFSHVATWGSAKKLKQNMDPKSIFPRPPQYNKSLENSCHDDCDLSGDSLQFVRFLCFSLLVVGFFFFFNVTVLANVFSGIVLNGQMDHVSYRGMIGSDSTAFPIRAHQRKSQKLFQQISSEGNFIEMNGIHSGVWWSVQSSADFNFETHVHWDMKRWPVPVYLSLYKRVFVAINNVAAPRAAWI